MLRKVYTDFSSVFSTYSPSDWSVKMRLWTATVIHGSPGHVIDRSLYLRLVAEWLLLRAFLHRLFHELHASTELSAFVCSPMPTHDNLVIIYLVMHLENVKNLSKSSYNQ